jgi:hypothetical protein
LCKEAGHLIQLLICLNLGGGQHLEVGGDAIDSNLEPSVTRRSAGEREAGPQMDWFNANLVQGRLGTVHVLLLHLASGVLGAVVTKDIENDAVAGHRAPRGGRDSEAGAADGLLGVTPSIGGHLVRHSDGARRAPRPESIETHHLETHTALLAGSLAGAVSYSLSSHHQSDIGPDVFGHPEEGLEIP